MKKEVGHDDDSLKEEFLKDRKIRAMKINTTERSKGRETEDMDGEMTKKLKGLLNRGCKRSKGK